MNHACAIAKKNDFYVFTYVVRTMAALEAELQVLE
jgi:hypothetical protein